MFWVAEGGVIDIAADGADVFLIVAHDGLLLVKRWNDGTTSLLVRQFGAVNVYTITEVFFFVAFAVRSQGTKLNTARKLLLHQALFSKGNLESLHSLQITSTNFILQ